MKLYRPFNKCNSDLVGLQFESKHPSDSESVIVLACNNVGGDMIIKSNLSLANCEEVI